MTQPLKLYGRDADDMQVISACLQDAVGQIGDIAYLEAERRFVMLANRYCWENDKAAMRVRAALQIAGVKAIAYRKLNLRRREGVISLLSVQFEPLDAPSGVISLIFAGGDEIRLEVEACEAILEDTTAPWAVRSQPAHEDDEA
jgi:hypothetical protein